MPRSDSHLSRSQLPLRTSEQLKAPFRKSESEGAAEKTFRSSEQGAETLSESEQIAADVLDNAFKRARLENKDIAFLCGVSISLVEKWRKKDARGCPSFVQMLLLPPKFHYALHKEMNARFGFGRQALLDLMDAAGSLAMAIE